MTFDKGARMKLGLAAIAAMVATMPAPAASDRIADFRVGGVSFSLPLPTGYCLPIGAQADIAQVLAAADTVNVTVLTLNRCDGAVVKGAGDYTLIKAPISTLVRTIDRATLIDELGKAFADTDAMKALRDKSVNDAAGSLEKLGGPKLNMTGGLLPRGRDEVCGYMGGASHVASGAIEYDQAVGSCITAVGGRVIVIHRYGTRVDDTGVLKLMREARAMALSIKTISGT